MNRSMKELTERQKLILSLVIHEYTRSAMPVGSVVLAERYHLELSPATIREAGYLRQPHTSAGRVPTEEGYRYFVGKLIQTTDLPAATRHTISHQFYQMRQDIDGWMRLAASVLAHQSRGASLITAPHADRARFKHLNLISTRGRQVLMVLVLIGGEIHQQMLNLTEPVSQETLNIAAAHLTQLFDGLDAEGIKALPGTFTPLEQDILGLVTQELTRAERLIAGEIYLDGMTNMLAEPEFSGSDEARRALRVLEERSLLEDLLSRTVLTSSVGGVHVLIGGEGNWEELRQCSVVLARYGAPGTATGTLGVLGPMRMPYGHTISTVRFVAGILSDLVSDSLAN